MLIVNMHMFRDVYHVSVTGEPFFNIHGGEGFTFEEGLRARGAMKCL